jgi:VWFA-related protein
MRCALIILLAFSLAAQEPRFGAQSRLVLMPISVKDRFGEPVDGLEASDFVILDEGRPQKVLLDTFGTGVAPIALVIAVQSSDISSIVLEDIWKLGPMIQPLITGEFGAAAIVSFSERVDWLQDWTKDPEAITRALRRIRPSEEEKTGRMLDAAMEAIERLRKRPNDRRVLMLISETRDRSSETDLNTVALAAQTAGVTVYAATYSAFKVRARRDRRRRSSSRATNSTRATACRTARSIRGFRRPKSGSTCWRRSASCCGLTIRIRPRFWRHLRAVIRIRSHGRRRSKESSKSWGRNCTFSTF